MEALTEMVNIIGKVMSGIGLATVIYGGYIWFDGYKSDNSADQSRGLKMLIGGGGMILIALNLIPKLANIFA